MNYTEFNKLAKRIWMNASRYRMDEDGEGRWITTENGHKVHLNKNGEPDVGSPPVVAAMQAEKLESVIKKYGITLGDGGKLRINNVPKSAKERDEAMREVKELKPLLLTYIADKNTEEQNKLEKQEKNVSSIKGLEEIRNALSDNERWNREFSASFESERGGGVGVRQKPNHDIDALKKQYPVAAAYLKAESYAYNKNYEMAEIGRKALERIKDDPNSYEEAISDMEKELEAFTQRNVWN